MNLKNKYIKWVVIFCVSFMVIIFVAWQYDYTIPPEAILAILFAGGVPTIAVIVIEMTKRKSKEHEMEDVKKFVENNLPRIVWGEGTTEKLMPYIDGSAETFEDIENKKTYYAFFYTLRDKYTKIVVIAKNNPIGICDYYLNPSKELRKEPLAKIKEIISMRHRDFWWKEWSTRPSRVEKETIIKAQKEQEDTKFKD